MQEEIDKSPFQTKYTKPGYVKYQDVNSDGFITKTTGLLEAFGKMKGLDPEKF